MQDKDKRLYLLRAVHEQSYLHSAFVMRAFAVTKLRRAEPGVEFKYVCELFESEKKTYCYFYDGEWVDLGIPVSTPLFRKLERIELSVGDVPNVDRDLVTTVGNVIYNCIALVYPFGNRIPFVTGRVKPGDVEKEIAKRVVDDPAEGQELKPGELSTADTIKFIDASVSLAGFSQVFCVGATDRTMTASPKALARCKELLREHKDQLTDPVVVANIAKEVAALDREWIAEDPNGGVYLKDKSYLIVRMRKFYFFGMEAAFDGSGTYTFINNALSDGWDISKLPEMSNSVRDGSIARGIDTAMGGVKVKEALRAMGGVVVAEEDCGSKVGEYLFLSNRNIGKFVGNTIFENGKLLMLTEENIKNYEGKIVEMRSPATCNMNDGNYCRTCLGAFVRGRERALASMASDVASQMMGIAMAKMHGKALKTVKLDFTTP